MSDGPTSLRLLAVLPPALKYRLWQSMKPAPLEDDFRLKFVEASDGEGEFWMRRGEGASWQKVGNRKVVLGAYVVYRACKEMRLVFPWQLGARTLSLQAMGDDVCVRVVRVEDRWGVVGSGLLFDSLDEAVLEAERRMAHLGYQVFWGLLSWQREWVLSHLPFRFAEKDFA